MLRAMARYPAGVDLTTRSSTRKGSSGRKADAEFDRPATRCVRLADQQRTRSAKAQSYGRNRSTVVSAPAILIDPY
jgi:hypothetical protein